ncbi:MAG: oligosaccharide repeat unit polymerase [Sphingomonadales bacterium]|nr:oligosaccharide repeat unit polymerase [Sphingomonadales bacterium]
MIYSCIPFLCVGLILYLWFFNSQMDRSSISPSALFLGYWFFASLCPMLAWWTSLIQLEHQTGYLFVVAAAGTVFASSLFRPTSSCSSGQNLAQNHLGDTIRRRLLVTYGWLVFLAFTYPVALYFQARTTLGVGSLLDAPAIFAEARYTIDWNPGFFINGLNTFVFSAAALSGLLAADSRLRRRYRLIIIAGLLPGFATYYLTAARSGLIFSATFWLSAYLAATTYLDRHRKLGFLRFLGGGFLVVALALPVIHIGYMIRTNTYSWEESKTFGEKSLSTAFGHMPVLGQWLDSAEYANLPDLELKSLAGITEKLGLASREQGLYDISYAVGSDESLSNIYTAFRPLIEDGRGMFGGLVILFLCCGCANLAWHHLRRGRIWGFPLVFSFNLYVLWSMITSIYIYLSTIMAAILTSGVVVLIFLRDEKIRSREPHAIAVEQAISPTVQPATK